MTSSESISSSSQCTRTQTASDCKVTCGPTATTIDGSVTTTQTCTTDCLSMVKGCSVTGETTTTTLSSTTSVLRCPTGALDDSLPPAITARAIAPVGNAWHRRAAATDPKKFRSASPVSSLGSSGKGCGLDTMTPAAKPVTRPGYPRGAGRRHQENPQ